jgi:hypothetical protein
MLSDLLRGPSPEWIELDLDGWLRVDSHDNVLTFGRAPNDLLLRRCVAGPPDLVYSLDELDCLRKLLRLRAQDAGNKLISLDVVEIAGHRVMVVIYSRPTDGMYWSELCFPFRDFRLDLQLCCRVRPGAPVGLRDISVFLTTSQRGEVDKETCQGFYRDLYEPELPGGPLLRTLADGEEWDALFPDHELSRLRSQLRTVCRSLRLHRFLQLAPAYTGQPESILDLLVRASTDLKLQRVREALSHFELAVLLAGTVDTQPSA